MPDLNAREIAILAPIAAAVLWMGVYPESFLAPMRADVRAVVARMEPAKHPGDAHLTAGKPAAPAAHDAPGAAHGAHGAGHGEQGAVPHEPSATTEHAGEAH